MSHPSKTKGNGFERELVTFAKSSGLDAERAYASDGRALGEASGVDVIVERIRIQAKRRKSLPLWLQIPDGADAVAIREDRGEPLVLLRYFDLLDLLKEIKDGAGAH